MAETVGELFVRLGLDIADLDSGFVDANRALRENMSRLSRENTIINLQTQADLTGLDELLDAERILAIRTDSLNRRIDNQRAKLELASAAWADAARRTGENSDETQRARIAVERERLELARLEQQLQSLNSTQGESEEGAASLTERFEAITEQAAPLVAGIVAVAGAMMKAHEMTVRLIERFQELQTMSAKLNLPLMQTDDFVRKIRLAGGEIEDVMGYIRGITDAMVKGETDDPEWIALTRYGAKIFEATGRLKNFKELFEETRRAFEKARAEGNEIEFLQMTGGESGVTDVIQAFTNWNQAVQDANKIFQSGFDPKRLSNAQRQMALLNEQTNEFSDALASVAEPAVTIVVENLFEVFRVGTKAISENRKELFKWGDSFVRAAAHASGFGSVFESIYGIDDANRALKEFDKTWSDFRREEEDFFRKRKLNPNPLHQYSDQRTKDLREEFEDLRNEIDNFDNEYEQQRAEIETWAKRAYDQTFLSPDEKEAINKVRDARIEKLLQSLAKESDDRMEDMLQEMADVQFESEHTAFENQIYAIEKWKNSALEDLEEYKKALTEKGRFEQEQAAIAAAAFAKEAEAFGNEMDRIRQNVQSLEEKIFEQEHSRRDIDVMRAQKQREQYLEAGFPEERIQRWFENELNRIARNSSEDYSKDPELPRHQADGFQIMYGDELEGLDLASKNFYNEIQEATDRTLEFSSAIKKHER